jgi:hypothetical protein
MTSEVNFSGHSFSLERDSKGKYKFTLGNLSDAGWFWDGKPDEALGFLVRVGRSNFTPQFVKDAEENKFTLGEMKPVLEKALKKNDGLYEISGDNRVWKFGEGLDDAIDRESEVEHYVEEGLTQEEAEEEVDEKLSNMKTSYEDFEKQYGKDYKKEMAELLGTAQSFDDFFKEIDTEDFRYNWIERGQEYASNAYYKAKGKHKMKKSVKV